MDTKVVLGIAVVFVIMALFLYFMMSESDDSMMMPVLGPDVNMGTPVAVGTSNNNAGGGSVTIVWSKEETPSGYVGNTVSGYPQSMSLEDCKGVVSSLTDAVGLTYNTRNNKCYPKTMMDPSMRKRYKDVVAYRKL